MEGGDGTASPVEKGKGSQTICSGGKSTECGSVETVAGSTEKEGLGEEVVFNLSHSGNYVLCAFSDRPREEVGCDIEVVKTYLPRIAKRFFTDAEYQRLEEADKGEQSDLFFRHWVLKESFMKATRLGTRLDTRSFEIEWEKGMPKLAKKPEQFSREYAYREFFLDHTEVRAAVCSTDREIRDKIEIYVF